MSYPTSQSQQGFTLIELMVTISIIVLVTGIALTRYSAFNSTILLNNEAYEVALDIRRAQAYGLSASGYGGDFRSPYGICFDRIEPDRYRFFQDVSGNGQCSGGEILETIMLDSRFVISELCADNNCRSVPSSKSESLTILFERPNFVAKLWSSWDTKVNTVTITLSEANGANPASKKILVESTGYISVQ